MIRILYISFSLLFACKIVVEAQVKYPDLNGSDQKKSEVNQISNEFMPVIGVWVWGERDLQPEGYKPTIDKLSKNSPYNLIVPFLRFPDKEITDDVVYNQVKAAAEYAVKNNIGLLPDLDVRSARRAFNEKYPGEQQEMLRLKEIDLAKDSRAELSVRSIKDLNDHYSGGVIPKYNSLKSSLLRVYAYDTTAEGMIQQQSLKDITSECRLVHSSDDSVGIDLPSSDELGGLDRACAMVSFTLFYPDVFGPNLIQFQRELLEKYADVPLPGACKDEWGFPPYYPRFYQDGQYDFWYSEHRAGAYSERTSGRDLLADCLLMGVGIEGQETARQVAINHFREMSYQRNTEIEDDFYESVKEIFGPDAAVTVHPTWWPYPDFNEYKKNGLDWWESKRDWAQTDELTPFAARTALCKKWGSPVWYNMYYTAKLSDQVWSSALAGGRINYLGFRSLYDKDIMRAENRIRLLNYISTSPMDCQVAVVFGHHATMNWAHPYFNDVGMQLVNALWNAGYPADLIPSTEIENGSLKVSDEGWVHYGEQKYESVILFQPEFEKGSTSDFFRQAGGGKTTLIRIGEWTKDFAGNPVDQGKLWPEEMKVLEDEQMAFNEIVKDLKNRGISRQTPATHVLDSSYFKLRGYEHTSYFPPRTGFSRLIDGTHIFIAGTENVSGDPIKSDFEINGYEISIDAIGVAGVRLNDKGELEALAASDLSYFQAGDFQIELEKSLDIALWKDKEGNWKGVMQAEKGKEVPVELLEITSNWTHLLLPEYHE